MYPRWWWTFSPVELGVKKISTSSDRRSFRVNGRLGGEICRRTFCEAGGEKWKTGQDCNESWVTEREAPVERRTLGFIVNKSIVRSASSLRSMSINVCDMPGEGGGAPSIG